MSITVGAITLYFLEKKLSIKMIRIKFKEIMKGKNKFTQEEVAELRKLLTKRPNVSKDEQKKIRHRMRLIGFYGQDDWGITNCRLSDLEALIESGQI
mgnify:FL=1